MHDSWFVWEVGKKTKGMSPNVLTTCNSEVHFKCNLGAEAILCQQSVAGSDSCMEGYS